MRVLKRAHWWFRRAHVGWKGYNRRDGKCTLGQEGQTRTEKGIMEVRMALKLLKRAHVILEGHMRVLKKAHWWFRRAHVSWKGYNQRDGKCTLGREGQTRTEKGIMEVRRALKLLKRAHVILEGHMRVLKRAHRWLRRAHWWLRREHWWLRRAHWWLRRAHPDWKGYNLMGNGTQIAENGTCAA